MCCVELCCVPMTDDDEDEENGLTGIFRAVDRPFVCLRVFIWFCQCHRLQQQMQVLCMKVCLQQTNKKLITKIEWGGISIVVNIYLKYIYFVRTSSLEAIRFIAHSIDSKTRKQLIYIVFFEYRTLNYWLIEIHQQIYNKQNNLSQRLNKIFIPSKIVWLVLK